MHLLKEPQYDELTVSLERKTIHRVFFKQRQEEGWDASGPHVWLLDGRVQARTEALIMAAQDGVVLTRAFRNRVMGKAVSPACCVCKGAPETTGHILSSCAPLQRTLYKETQQSFVSDRSHAYRQVRDNIAEQPAVGIGQVERSECFGRKGLEVGH